MTLIEALQYAVEVGKLIGWEVPGMKLRRPTDHSQWYRNCIGPYWHNPSGSLVRSPGGPLEFDLDDPATTGCLRSTLRGLWNDGSITTLRNGSRERGLAGGRAWRVISVDSPSDPLSGEYPTEGGALEAAIIAWAQAHRLNSAEVRS